MIATKAPPSESQQVAQLVAIGIEPDTAQRIVSDCAARGYKTLTASESRSRANVTKANIEQARHFWYYTPTVPTDFRRILDASDAKDDA